MWGGHGDQNSDNHLKKGVTQRKYPQKTLKCKNLECFWPVTEEMAFLIGKN